MPAYRRCKDRAGVMSTSGRTVRSGRLDCRQSLRLLRGLLITELGSGTAGSMNPLLTESNQPPVLLLKNY